MGRTVRGRRLKSAEHPPAHAMCRPFDVEASGVLLAPQNLVAVWFEAYPLKRLSRMLQFLLALEQAYDETPRIGEALELGGVAQLRLDASPARPRAPRRRRGERGRLRADPGGHGRSERRTLYPDRVGRGGYVPRVPLGRPAACPSEWSAPTASSSAEISAETVRIQLNRRSSTAA